MTSQEAVLAPGAYLLAAPLRAGFILETTDSIEIVTSTAANIDYNCSWTDNTTTAFTPGKTAGAVASAGATTTVARAWPSTEAFTTVAPSDRAAVAASSTVARTATVTRGSTASQRKARTDSMAPPKAWPRRKCSPPPSSRSSGGQSFQSADRDPGHNRFASYLFSSTQSNRRLSRS